MFELEIPNWKSHDQFELIAPIELSLQLLAIDELHALGSQYIAGDEAAFELITGEEEVTVEFIDEIISSTSGLECDSRIFEPFLGQIKQSMMTCMNTIKTMI